MAIKKKMDLDALLAQIVQLLVFHHPSTLTFSKVSRLTGVPRPTLYYYFGKERSAMIEEAVRFGVKSFSQITSLSREKKFATWEKYQQARFRVSTRLMRKYPWAPALYFRFRNDPGKIGEIVREMEARFISGTMRQWKKFHGTEPDRRAVELASALKLGYLWGVSNLGDSWMKGDEKKVFERLIELITRVSGEAMRERFR